MITVIGDYHKNWEETELVVMDRKNAGLVRHVVGIGCNCHHFGGMFVVRGIGPGWPGRRHYEFFPGQTNQRDQSDGG
jgi:hypothetical protein